MSAILGTSVTGAGGASAYSVSNSLRIRTSASASLSRTPSSTGNQRTFTFSFWVKRGSFGDNDTIIGTRDSSANQIVIMFENTNKFRIFSETGAGANDLITTAVYRDPSAWYHVVIAFDTTQATAANRTRLYINGQEVTSFSSTAYPAQNTDLPIFISGQTARIGARSSNDQFFDGYLSEFNFIDGQALTPSSFGETNASTGVWVPKAYAGSYGTNGFYQKYSSIATTSGSNTGLGQDFSGNGNYFNTNNISVTAGSTYDAMIDSPTPVSDTVGNYAVMNPLSTGDFGTIQPNALSQGNLVFSTSTTNTLSKATISIPISSTGKFYCEFTQTAIGGGTPSIGIIENQGTSIQSASFKSIAYRSGGNITNSGADVTTGLATYTTGDVIAMAVDMSVNNGQIAFYKNNTLITTVQNLKTTYFVNTDFCFACQTNSSSTTTYTVNFGQRPFAYTPPTGFNRIQTFNLPAPTIGASATTLASKNMNVLTYTGNSATSSAGTVARTLTGLGFQPDLIWVKSRNNGGTWSDHSLTDSVRGANQSLSSNTTGATINVTTAFSAGGVGSGSADGFTIVSGTDGITTNLNSSSGTYVGWCWKANGSGSTNTAGTITSTVSANQTAGFSIVTYTGNGSSGATVGHGLGSTPAMVIIKSRSNGSADWQVFHQLMNGGSSPWNYSMYLNGTSGQFSYTGFNNTAPTSTVFTLGSNGGVNGNGSTFVAYCFAEKTGFSKFGGYTGNGSNDGPFIYTGFRPEYIMIKRANSSSNWTVIDAARYPVNTTGPDNPLRPNTSEAETGGSDRFALGDILSNGFKLRYFDSSTNVNGGTYIYMAFAEFPFNYSLAR